MEPDYLSPPVGVEGSLGLLWPVEHSRRRPVCGSYNGGLAVRLVGTALQCLLLALQSHGGQPSLGRAEGNVVLFCFVLTT